MGYSTVKPTGERVEADSDLLALQVVLKQVEAYARSSLIERIELDTSRCRPGMRPAVIVITYHFEPEEG